MSVYSLATLIFKCLFTVVLFLYLPTHTHTHTHILFFSPHYWLEPASKNFTLRSTYTCCIRRTWQINVDLILMTWLPCRNHFDISLTCFLVSLPSNTVCYSLGSRDRPSAVGTIVCHCRSQWNLTLDRAGVSCQQLNLILLFCSWWRAIKRGSWPCGS